MTTTSKRRLRRTAAILDRFVSTTWPLLGGGVLTAVAVPVLGTRTTNEVAALFILAVAAVMVAVPITIGVFELVVGFKNWLNDDHDGGAS